MSASAPLGSPSRNIGSVEAVCTSATSAGSEVSVVISQAADTSCIHSEMLAASQAAHSMRNVALRSGAIAPRSVSSIVALMLSRSIVQTTTAGGCGEGSCRAAT